MFSHLSGHYVSFHTEKRLCFTRVTGKSVRRPREWVESFPIWAEEVSSWNEQRHPLLCKSVYYFVLLIISKVGLGLYFL